MDDDKSLRLLLRQVKDIQAQADKILSGEDSPENMETLSKYSGELKNYVASRIVSPEVHECANQIPTIVYTRNQASIFSFLSRKGSGDKSETLAEIRVAREKYGNIELILKGLIN